MIPRPFRNSRHTLIRVDTHIKEVRQSMDYLYEIDHFLGTRRIKATYVPPRSDSATDFQPVVFTDDQLMAYSEEMFLTTRLETLVQLFTQEDPAKLLSAFLQTCEHFDYDECDCTRPTIPIPTVLAFHTHVLWERFANIEEDFMFSPRPKASNPSDHPSQFQETIFHEREVSRKILDEWHQQGIALYQAWQPANQPSA